MTVRKATGGDAVGAGAFWFWIPPRTESSGTS